MRILLTTLNAKYIHLNLAIRLLYELNEGHEGLEWKEFTIKEDPEKIAAFCKDFEVVAFSCYIWNITQTLAAARAIKAINPGIKILLGGPEVSYEWEDIIVRPEVDYIITGEGEIPFQQFLNNYPHLDAVSGLVRKADEQILQSPEAGIFDLNNYAAARPYRHDNPEDLRNKVLYIETSRGCPYKCEFCLASLDNKMRYLPNESLKANLLYLMQHGRVIKFLDRTFNIKRDFTLDIFQFILDHHRPENVFQFEITADIIHPEIIAFIQEKVPQGLFRFEIGIQTVNQQANLEVSRKQNFDKTKGIILQLRDKVEMHLDLIVGLPLDYWADIRYSFEEVFKLFAPELQLGFLKFLKGTPMRLKQAEHGYLYDPEPPYQIIESKYLSRAELHQITLLEEALEVYWNKDRARNPLRYAALKYSSFDFLLKTGQILHDSLDAHQAYNIADIYKVMMQAAQELYPTDTKLQSCIAVDYYLHHKTKPADIFNIELPQERFEKILQSQATIIEKKRFVLLNMEFDWAEFMENGTVHSTPSLILLGYDGKSFPEAIAIPERQLLPDFQYINEI